MPGEVRVFISYSTVDRALVDPLKERLKQAGVDVWLDHEHLVPGEPHWVRAVYAGIDQATHVVYAGSETAAMSPYVHQEVARALRQNKLMVSFWILGPDWDECCPSSLYLSQYIDGRGSSFGAGLAKLLTTLGVSTPERPPAVAPPPQPVRAAPAPVIQTSPAAPRHPLPDVPPRLASLGFRGENRDGVPFILPPLCAIPAGPFRLGSDIERDKDATADILKRITVDLPGYLIARFPVTVAEYACFLRDASARHAEPKSWRNQITWQQQLAHLDHPIINVSWYDAFDYAVWLKERMGGQPWRLVTEAEWEKAARLDPREPLGASSERIYPWGDSDDTARRNGRDSGVGATTPVGWYNGAEENARAGRRSGASPCGVEEMAGNVWEWTASPRAVDYTQVTVVVSRESSSKRIVRGGSWYGGPVTLRAADRPDLANYDLGFRVLLAAHDSPS